MPLAPKDFIDGKIYLEENNSLALKVDYAWSLYSASFYNKQIKEKALQFLLFAFDIPNTNKNMPQLLERLMVKREKYKQQNPDYLPGKSPHHTRFHSGKIVALKTTYCRKSSISSLNRAMAFDEVLDVRDSQKIKDKQVRMFNSLERKKFNVHIHQGLFKKNGSVFTTSAMHSHGKAGYASFTLNLDGELSIFNHRGGEAGDDGVRHSSLNAGLPVVAAGEIKIIGGKLKALTTHSGHYYPSLFNIHRVLEHFSKHDVAIDEAKVITFEDPSKILPSLVSKKFCRLIDNEILYSTEANQIYTVKDTKLAMKKELIQCVGRMMHSMSFFTNRNSTPPLTSMFGSLLKRLKSPEKKRNSITATPPELDLPQEHALLVREFENHLIEFKKMLVHTELATVYDLKWKIKELKTLIETYETKNSDLTIRFPGKGMEEQGRLAAVIGIFKWQAKTIINRMEIEDELLLQKMKYIDCK